jgi:hypothetical protein
MSKRFQIAAVLLEVDRRARAMVLAHRVDRGRIADAAQIFAPSFRRDDAAVDESPELVGLERGARRLQLLEPADRFGRRILAAGDSDAALGKPETCPQL